MYVLIKDDKELAETQTWLGAKLAARTLIEEDPDLSPVDILIQEGTTAFLVGTAGVNGYEEVVVRGIAGQIELLLHDGPEAA